MIFEFWYAIIVAGGSMEKLNERVLIYQKEHNVSYDEALKALQAIDYNNLICSGFSLELAEEIVYGKDKELEGTTQVKR